MSEFEARCGCLLSSHELLDGRCPIHDEPIVRMDGLTDRELRKLEWEWDTRESMREEGENGE